MSAYLEQTDDRLFLLRINGELRKSELDAVQTELAGKFASAKAGPAYRWSNWKECRGA